MSATPKSNENPEAGDAIAKTAEAVGYGKPPVAHRFKLGKSGNPTGRPRRPGDYNQAVLQDLNSVITVREDGIKRKMPKYQLLAKKTVADALAGKPGAIKQLSAALDKLASSGLIRSPEELAAQDKYRELVNDLLSDVMERTVELSMYRKWVGPLPANLMLTYDRSPRSGPETATLKLRARLEPSLTLYEAKPDDPPFRRSFLEKWNEKYNNKMNRH
jgi:hypothetical protein